jgi:ArsR family transcriptional regulator, arsenate/arsenite/antimonite-responsive transcriptional repressor
VGKLSKREEVDLTRIYRCLSDKTRLRIFHLLAHCPLCVSHMQDVLELPQTKVSQHLGGLRKQSLAEARRLGTWMVYSLPVSRAEPLDAVVCCVKNFGRADMQLFMDFKRLEKLKSSIKWKRGVMGNGSLTQKIPVLRNSHPCDPPCPPVAALLRNPRNPAAAVARV